jgi:hypothetical protein
MALSLLKIASAGPKQAPPNKVDRRNCGRNLTALYLIARKWKAHQKEGKIWHAALYST